MRVRITKDAAGELRTILRYIAKHSISGAKRVQLRIKAVSNLLAEQPFAGHTTDVEGLRRVTASPFPYVIFYEIAPTEIIIVSVRHGSRDPSRMPDA